MLAASKPVQRALTAAGELPAPWLARGPISRVQMQQWLAHESGPWLPT